MTHHIEAKLHFFSLIVCRSCYELVDDDNDGNVNKIRKQIRHKSEDGKLKDNQSRLCPYLSGIEAELHFLSLIIKRFRYELTWLMTIKIKN